MAQDSLERWWMMFTDDPCDDVCANLHEWVRFIRKVKNENNNHR